MTFDSAAFSDELIRIFRENRLDALLDGDKTARLSAFAALLVETNEKFNLTAVTDPEEIAFKHFADCAALIPLLPRKGKILDVGCGAGFPSLVLAILCPDLSVVALDATEKKVRFVSDCAAALGLANLTAVSGRAETLAAQGNALRESFDAVTARAVAPLRILSELCLPFVSVGGVFLAMKGQAAERETEEAKTAIPMLGGKLRGIVSGTLSDGGTETVTRAVAVVDKIRHTPPEYPRAYARIVKKPL